MKAILHSHNKFQRRNSVRLFEIEVIRQATEFYNLAKSEGINVSYEKVLADYFISIPFLWDYEKDCLRT